MEIVRDPRILKTIPTPLRPKPSKVHLRSVPHLPRLDEQEQACKIQLWGKVYHHHGYSGTIRWNLQSYICICTCILYYTILYYTSMHPSIHPCTYACRHACIHTCICTCVHAYLRTYIHTYAPTYTPTYIHAYIHTYIQTDRDRFGVYALIRH